MPPFLNNFDNLYYPDKFLTESPRQRIDDALLAKIFSLNLLPPFVAKMFIFSSNHNEKAGLP